MIKVIQYTPAQYEYVQDRDLDHNHRYDLYFCLACGSVHKDLSIYGGYHILRTFARILKQ